MGVTCALRYAAAIALTAPLPAGAQTGKHLLMQTGSDYVTSCESKDWPEFWTCLTFVQSFIQGVSVAEIEVGRQVLCLPSGGTNGQYKGVILAFLRRHPERWHQPLPMLARDGLQEAFPCPR